MANVSKGTYRIRGLVTLVLLLLFSCQAFARLKYEGIEATLITQDDGHFISGPLEVRARSFEDLTGAKITIRKLPFNQLYPEILKDLNAHKNSYDAFVYAPQWLVDFARTGYLEDLTGYVDRDPAIEWNDVFRFFRDFSSKYNDRIYTIPLDGDFHMVYYRIDVLEKHKLAPPATWDDYIEIARTVHGEDMNGDGVADYGSVFSKKPNGQGYWMIMSLASGILQSQGTRQGAFFDKKDMKPLVNNAGFRKALQLYLETNKYGPPNETELGTSDSRKLFISGRSALILDWGDIGPLSVSKASEVKGKVGAVILPGSRQIYNRETGELEQVSTENSPYSINGVNFAPYAAFGGWSASVHAKSDSQVRQAVYDFISYVSQPKQSKQDVTQGATGFNPYRISHVSDVKLWIDAGMNELSATFYLAAIHRSLNNPNMVLDLRIPQNRKYQGEILDQELYRLVKGETTISQTMQNIYAGWEKITSNLGRARQLEAYRQSFGE